MRTNDVMKLKNDLALNGTTLLGSLSTGVVLSAPKQANYTVIKDKLIALGIPWEGTGIADAAAIIGKSRTPAVTIQIERPPPPFDAAKALEELIAEHGHHASIAGVEVYLDKNQAAHQPLNAPIGSRQTTGKTKFKNTIAGKPWHENNTMNQMAEWANELDDNTLTNGRKEFIGQSTPISGICYEGYCQLINGTRYVTYHCYPAGDTAGKKLSA